jgi:hypothetical protein
VNQANISLVAGEHTLYVAYNMLILCYRRDDPHQEQDAEVDGVRGQTKMLCVELNTFDPTYFDIIEIAFKMSKWEPNYNNGVSQTLKVTAPFQLETCYTILLRNQ